MSTWQKQTLFLNSTNTTSTNEKIRMGSITMKGMRCICGQDGRRQNCETSARDNRPIDRRAIGKQNEEEEN